MDTNEKALQVLSQQVARLMYENSILIARLSEYEEKEKKDVKQ